MDHKSDILEKNQSFLTYKEIFSLFRFNGHRFTQLNTTERKEFFSFTPSTSSITVYLFSDKEEFSYVVDGVRMNIPALSDYLFSHLNPETKRKYQEDYDSLRRDAFTLEINFSLCLSKEIEIHFSQKLENFIQLKHIKLKNNRKFYYILEFNLSFDGSNRTLEAFYERKHGSHFLIDCYEKGKNINPDFYLTLSDELKLKFEQNNLCFVLPDSDTVKKKFLKSFLSDFLMKEYKKTNDFKIRSVFQTI